MPSHIETPLFQMVASALQASDAPRFLLSMFTNGPGEHQILIDHPEVDEADNRAWLLVTDDEGPRIRLSFVSNFRDTDSSLPQVTAIWHHYLITDDTFREAKTVEETLPETYDYAVDLNSIAASSATIEDLCDACALPRHEEKRGQPAPDPLESHPPFTGAL